MNDEALSFQEDNTFRCSAVSPVSPKPQSHARIPILQNQMDPALNESSTYHEAYAQKTMSATATQDPANTSSEVDQHQVNANYTVANPELQELEAAPLDEAAPDHSANTLDEPEPNDASTPKSLEQSGHAQTHNPSAAPPSAQELDAAPTEPLIPYEAHPEAPQHNVASSVEAENRADGAEDDSQPVDIQALLDNIVNAASHGGSVENENIVAALQGAQMQRDATNQATAPAVAAPMMNVASTDSTHLPTPTQQQIVDGAPGTVSVSASLPSISNGAPVTLESTEPLAQPPSATLQQESSLGDQPAQPSPNSAGPAPSDRGGEEHMVTDGDVSMKDEDKRWGPEVQKEYDQFLEEERVYVQKGEWDKFPTNSRLFIGNLSSESVTKRDLYHVFHKYGKLAQVSIKQAYGFVQFLESQDCMRALQSEQGVAVRGKKIHLEISKPQTRRGGRNKENRRSRSPDRNNGGGGGGGGGRQRGDHYRGRDSNNSRRQRSPSPRGRHGRRRSRTRSPHGRYRDPSPRRDTDDDCPLPRRAPHEVPDVQIIAQGDPDRAFVGYVERAFHDKGVRTNVLLLSPRLSEASVMRRQIIEGVQAVMKLDISVQMNNKFSISVFDRSAGASNVRFDEYSQLDLPVAVELVLRAKQNSKQGGQAYNSYQSGPYGLPMVPAPPPQQQQQPMQAQMPPPPQQYGHQPPPPPQFAGMDPSMLQNLLSRVQQASPSHGQFGSLQQPGALNHMPELSRLLASVNGGAGQGMQNFQPQQHQQPPPQPQHQQQQSTAQLLASLAGNGHQQPPQQHQQQQPQQQQQPVDMKNILAGLARWKG